jgi:hypothetical protein
VIEQQRPGAAQNQKQPKNEEERKALETGRNRCEPRRFWRLVVQRNFGGHGRTKGNLDSKRKQANQPQVSQMTAALGMTKVKATTKEEHGKIGGHGEEGNSPATGVPD